MGVEKLVGGVILFIIGIWLLIPSSWCTSFWCPGLWKELWFIIKGVVPIAIVIIGALLIWIESEELKIEKPRKK